MKRIIAETGAWLLGHVAGCLGLLLLGIALAPFWVAALVRGDIPESIRNRKAGA